MCKKKHTNYKKDHTIYLFTISENKNKKDHILQIYTKLFFDTKKEYFDFSYSIKEEGKDKFHKIMFQSNFELYDKAIEFMIDFLKDLLKNYSELKIRDYINLNSKVKEYIEKTKNIIIE